MVGGQKKSAHHQEYCSDIFGVMSNVSSHLYDFGCGSDCSHVGLIVS